jgi:hypothetical protein
MIREIIGILEKTMRKRKIRDMPSRRSVRIYAFLSSGD